MNTIERLSDNLTFLKSIHQYRELKLKSGLIDFFSNDYLGLSKNVALLSQIETLYGTGFGSGGSRLLAGNSSKCMDLEVKLAQIHNKESALLFSSGYMANLAFFSTIPARNSIILYDEKIHACIKDGMRLSLASKISFKHNDLEVLRKRLEQNKNKECFVAIESIYSMDGDMAPIKEIAILCREFEANLVVDEAHSTGNYGIKGSGLVTSLGLDSVVFAKIHTFGKAISAHGAVIVGSKILSEYLVNHARPFIYTTALPTHDIEVINTIYNFLDRHWQDLQRDLNQRVEWFRESIVKPLQSSFSPIQVVLVPGNEQVIKLSKIVEKNGFDVRPVLSPTVPKGEERLRICLHNFNTKSEIQTLADCINSNIV